MESCARTTKGGEEEEQVSAYAFQLASSSVMPMVLQTVVELEVLEIIARAGPAVQLSATEIASQMAAAQNPDAPSMLDRMLRLLVSFSVLTCSLRGTTRFYGLAPVAKYYVRNQNGASMGPFMSLVQDKVFMDSWYELKAAILGGGVPFDRAHGTHAFDYPRKDSRFNEVFNKAMINHTTIVITKILDSYKGFDRSIKQLVDVGGGLGVTLHTITSKYPHIKGVNFDLPHVIQHTQPYPGVEHMGGDMFESVPKGDAIFMKWILHDWSDDHCLKLLKNCYKSLPDNGKVIVVEGIIPMTPDRSGATKAICQLDLLMMTQNPGGKERTQEEFLALATGAGFSGIRLECFACNFWVMEFYKYELKAAILGGGVPFDRVHGTNALDYPGKDPRFNEVFNKAMVNYTTIVITKILESYKGFDQNIKQLVDVGGGLGVTLNMITSKYPHMKGVNFDLPHVIQHAPSYPGVEHIGGDMFESVPKGDAIFMKCILHDWSSDHCLKLLKNCYKSLPDNGKVIVLEGIVPIIPDNSGAAKAICQLDLLMMTQNPGGKERTQEEFLALATGAGFSGIRLECFACNFWVMEFYK